MAEVLGAIAPMFPAEASPNLMVGLSVSDDAAVYKVNDDVAVIQTLDFFTPVVDDPYDFGAIAAANALSDVYAMGGRATLAMNIFCVPQDLPQEAVGQILKGGAEKVREAGAVLVGGHTVEDSEPKFGLSVMGMTHPEKVLTKADVKIGDMLILTKPLGTGFVTHAHKKGHASQEALAAATHSMKKLNKAAAEILARHPIKACTDVTGYSLLGHAHEMAEKSQVALRLHSAQLPLLPEVQAYFDQGVIPCAARRNQQAYQAQLHLDGQSAENALLYFGPETSGGLLFSVAQEHLAAVLADFDAQQEPYWIIGCAEQGNGTILD
ncbi:selenophosphate synthetase [Photobacterium jeanii]|uniref:Selenophosphate synthetase n=2 Tax=Photobacterium jeanii TaxID=858640 RepID=A0A178K9P3_9GAMM|nr:selenophosphate synthetase [Photobacterium jeanii]